MRCSKMSSFIVMDIVRDALKYEDAVHFEVGQPDLPPSPKVKEALHDAIDSDKFSYTQSLGLLELREKIAGEYKKTYNLDIDPKRIFLTPGTSGAFLIAYSLTLKNSARLGLSDPSYPCYKNFAYMMDIEPVFMPIDKKDDFELHVEDLKQKKLDALQISSPSNPTGNIYKRENLKDLIQYCDEHDMAFISDELYHGLTYEGEASCALEFSDRAYVVNGFSKYYCVPGNRLGWIIVPEDKLKEAEILSQNLFISAPTLSQYGALAAFDDEYQAKVKEEFKRRRDYLYGELSQIFEIDAAPQGAFYLWANISKYNDDSFAFAKELLENIHVASTPGVDFGKNGTNKYIRFAYTRNIEHLSEGVRRMKEYLGVTS